MRVADRLDLPINFLMKCGCEWMVSIQAPSLSGDRAHLLMLLVVPMVWVDRRPDLLFDPSAQADGSVPSICSASIRAVTHRM